MKKILFYLLLFLALDLGGQNKIDSLRYELSTSLEDTTRIDVLHSLAGRLIRSNPDSALIHARASFALTENLDDEDRHSRSYRRMGHALYVTNNLEEFKTLLLSSVDYATEIEDFFSVAASYRNLSKIGESTKQPDSSTVNDHRKALLCKLDAKNVAQAIRRGFELQLLNV